MKMYNFSSKTNIIDVRYHDHQPILTLKKYISLVFYAVQAIYFINLFVGPAHAHNNILHQ